MSILKGDIKLKKTQVMQDVPEGGGAPTSETIPDGGNNTIMPDISEVDRAGGRFNLRKTVVHVDTNNVDEYLGANILVARPPNDPNVSIAIMSASSLFDVRADAANRVESYLVSGPIWSGVLMNDHYAGQRNIQLFQRVGTAPPNVGRTLVLTYLPGTGNQRQQYVRILNREIETRTFSHNSSGGTADYQVQVVTCEISDALRFDFPGSEPNRLFTQETGKTTVRDTSAADAASYFGTQPLVVDAEIGDVGVKAASVYAQLVPNSRTERTELDVRPAAVRNIVLAETPRRIEIASSPHTQRIRIGQENRTFSHVSILTPLPAAGTVDVSFMALGEWYSLQDDGGGRLTGSGVGTVNYTTGSISVTLPSLPDVNSHVIFTWGEKTAFTNRSGQAGFRRPEYVFQVEDGTLEPGSLTITWTSAGLVRTAADNGTGVLSGSAVGSVDYASGTIHLRPNFMIDPGGEFDVQYDYREKVTENMAAVAPDGAGFATLTLAQIPVARSVCVRWVTYEQVTKSSGSTMASGSSTKSSSTSSLSVTKYSPAPIVQDTANNTNTPGVKNPPANRVPVNGGSTANLAPGSNFESYGLYTRVGQTETGVPVFGVLFPQYDPAEPYAGYFYEIPDPGTVITDMSTVNQRPPAYSLGR